LILSIPKEMLLQIILMLHMQNLLLANSYP